MDTIYKILTVGASGFTFLMLYLGYQLTSEAQRKILEVNLSETDVRKLEIWSNLAERQVANTRYFMGFALAFLVAGLLVLIYRPDVDLILRITPPESRLAPVVYAQAQQVLLDSAGSAPIKVRSEHSIAIDNMKLFNEINSLKMELHIARTGQRLLSTAVGNQSSDAGFGTMVEVPK